MLTPSVAKLRPLFAVAKSFFQTFHIFVQKWVFKNSAFGVPLTTRGRDTCNVRLKPYKIN